MSRKNGSLDGSRSAEPRRQDRRRARLGRPNRVSHPDFGCMVAPSPVALSGGAHARRPFGSQVQVSNVHGGAGRSLGREVQKP